MYMALQVSYPSYVAYVALEGLVFGLLNCCPLEFRDHVKNFLLSVAFKI